MAHDVLGVFKLVARKNAYNVRVPFDFTRPHQLAHARDGGGGSRLAAHAVLRQDALGFKDFLIRYGLAEATRPF